MVITNSKCKSLKNWDSTKLTIDKKETYKNLKLRFKNEQMEFEL
jgi:hypothetical protein